MDSTNSSLPTLDIERVKKFNADLKQKTEKASKLTVEMELTTTELKKMCAELSNELQTQVTLENLEQIYRERCDKVNSTLQIGEDILKRIENEENGQGGDNPTPGYENFQPNNIQPVPQFNQQPGYQQAPNMQAAPSYAQQTAPQYQAQPTQQPVAPGFANLNPGAPVNNSAQQNQNGNNTLPNMFGGKTFNI